MPYDPLQLAQETERIVVNGKLKKYYRTSRPGRWYGGIASADCCGCNLRCVFCWSGAPRDNPERMGKFYTPEHVFEKLIACAERFGYNQLRVSGNEPTIGKEHLMDLLEFVEQTSHSFILETNGTLIGEDKNYAERLSRFKSVHVRVSLKGTTPEEFKALTGADAKAFELQLKALENLIDTGIKCHPAVMLSFSSKEDFENLVKRIRAIDSNLAGEVEKEYVFLYPHVINRLRKAGIEPKVAYSPKGIPTELI